MFGHTNHMAENPIQFVWERFQSMTPPYGSTTVRNPRVIDRRTLLYIAVPGILYKPFLVGGDYL